MPGAPTPENEPHRLDALRECNVLDTEAEQAFDDLTRLASELCGTPIALVSLVDEARQWFKSRIGLDATETPRSQALCGYTILSDDPFVIENAGNDPRTRDNPLVTGELHLRFYAGVPLTLSSGERLGSLCVIDTKPRSITEAQLSNLTALARQASTQLELRRERAETRELLETTQRAREELAVLQERFEHALAGSADGLWDWNLQTDEVWYSTQFMRLLAIPPEGHDAFAPVFDSFASRLHPRDKDSTTRAIEAHLRDEAPYDVTYRLRLDDGTYRWFRARGRSIRDESGQPVRMSGSLTDIHDQHTTENRLQLAIHAAGIGLWDWDVPSGQTYFSDTFYTMLGYEPGELPMTLQTWKDVTHPDDLQPALDDLQHHFEGRSPYYINEHRLRTKSGDYIWIRDVGEVVEWDEQNNPRRVIGVHVDVDAQTRARQQLAALEQQLRLFVQHIPAAVAMFDRDMRYLVASEGWYSQYGLEQHVIGRSHYEVFPSIPERWKQIHQRVLEGESLDSDRDAFTRVDGSTTWVRWALRPWYDAEGQTGGLVMFTEVIDDQVEREKALEQLNDELRAQTDYANDMADKARAASNAKSEFLANMSHEIRTPMTAIMGFADILEEHDHDQTPEAIRSIRSNARHLLAIINDILDMSKIEAGRMHVERIDTDPVEIAREAMGLVSHRAESRGLSLRLLADTPVPEHIRTDPTRLRQIVLNLLSNAIKFTDEGGVCVHIECEPDSQRLRLRVNDTGVGLTPDQLEAVLRFEPFSQADYSTTRNYGGTGLGLRISNALARALGGGIDATSSKDQGSQFTVTIDTGDLTGVALRDPRNIECEVAHDANDATAPPPADSEPRERPLRGVRILVAEDSPDNQRLFAHHLQRAGADVRMADNGAEALQRIENDTDEQPFDLVLMDMQMPELDGYEASRTLRQRSLRLPIIAITAHAMKEDRGKCLDAGCDAYLTKPLNARTLIRTCLDTLSKHDTERNAA